MKKFSFVILLLLPLISFGQAEKRYRAIIVDSVKALNGSRVDVKDTLLLDSLAVYNTDLSSQYTSRSLVDSAFVGVAVSSGGANTIYSADDNLAGDRVIAQDANTLSFEGSVVNSFSVDGSTFSVDANNNRVGIGDASPSNRLVVETPTDNDGIFLKRSGTTQLELLVNSSFGGAIQLRNQSGTAVMLLNSFGGDDFINTGNQFAIGAGSASSKLRVETPTNGDGIILTRSGTSQVELLVHSSFGGAIQLRSQSGSAIALLNSFGGDDFINTGNELAIGLGAASAKLHVAGVNAAPTTDALLIEDNANTKLLLVENAGDVGINNFDPTAKLHVIGDVIIDSLLSTTEKDLTLGVAATTFSTRSNVMTMTGDGGGNTIATITGANSGMVLNLIFVDGNITITDDNTHAVNSVDLSAAFTGADDTTIQIVFDGTSWYEISRSTN